MKATTILKGIFHITDRMKGYVKSAPIGSWYEPYIGKYLWVSRHTYDKNTGEISLKFGPTDRVVMWSDLFMVPWPFRKMFHAINLELNPIEGEESEEEIEDEEEEMDDEE